MNSEEQYFTDSHRLRIKAEEELKKKQDRMNPPELEGDMKRLLHELQVHQIQLELQNEELREAYETSEAALKKYTLLYDFAPVGYFTLDHEGRILDLNFTASEMLGDRRISIINSYFKLFVTDDSKMDFDNFFQKIHASEGKETCELNLGYGKELLCHVLVEGVLSGDSQNSLLSVMDISGFRSSKSKAAKGK